MGCHLSVRQEEGGTIEVSGNLCPKGDAYGREEATSPKRTVTAVVRTDSARFPYMPVRTDKPLPRALIGDLIRELSCMRIRLPAALGSVVIPDFRNTGVRVVLTRTLPPDKVPSVGQP